MFISQDIKIKTSKKCKRILLQSRYRSNIDMCVKNPILIKPIFSTNKKKKRLARFKLQDAFSFTVKSNS